jgi:hypothetical protein
MIGQAALAIWFDVDPAGEDEVNRWYPRQHLPERLSVPGFLRGRRYQATGPGPRFFTLYETADSGVLASPAYLERLNNPTDWTRRALPSFRRMIRNVYRTVAQAGDAAESHVFTARISPAPGRAEGVRDWLSDTGAEALGALAGVTGLGLYETETGGTAVVTEERRIVGDNAVSATPFLAVVEVRAPSHEDALRRFWSSQAAALGAEVAGDFYRLLYGLCWISPR